MKKVKEWGGLDEYLVRTPDEVILYPFAIRLKYEILRKRAESQREETLENRGIGDVQNIAKEDISKRGVLFNR